MSKYRSLIGVFKFNTLIKPFTVNNFLKRKNCVAATIRPTTSFLVNNYLKNFSTQQAIIATFEDMLNFIKNKNRLIIDVREPTELKETGVIPQSINIPLGEIETALKDMPDQEFLNKYGTKKPAKEYPLVFFCKIGVRSGKAQEIAKKLGYESTLNYLGSWTEWAEKYKA